MAVAHYFLRYAIAAALFAVAADAFCQTPGACFPLAANNICGSSFVGYGINSLYFDEFPATGVNTDTFNQVMIQRYETISVVADNFISNKGCSASASSFISQNFRYQLSFCCSCPPPAGSPVHGPALCTAQCQIATASVQSLLNDPTTCPATSNTTQSQGRTTTLGTFQTYCSTTAPADLATPNGGPCYAGVDQDVQFCGFLDATDMANGCSSLPNDPLLCFPSFRPSDKRHRRSPHRHQPHHRPQSPTEPKQHWFNLRGHCRRPRIARSHCRVLGPETVAEPPETRCMCNIHREPNIQQYLQDQRHKQDMEASGTYSSPRGRLFRNRMATNGLNDSLRSPLPTASMHNSSPASGKQSPYVRPTREYTPTPPPPPLPPKMRSPAPQATDSGSPGPPPQGPGLQLKLPQQRYRPSRRPNHQAARARPAAVARELPPPAAKPYTAPPPVRIGPGRDSPQHPEPTVVKVVHPYVPSISDELALSGVFPLICTLPPEDYAALPPKLGDRAGSYSSLGELSRPDQISSRHVIASVDDEDPPIRAPFTSSHCMSSVMGRPQ
ncbi:uncharacterized protein BJ171DRAFT_527157 [Polychytrium aggregatum]|uniref:uncharacterized protein n=1 Tax=Polychytrium aggregatum TaxID=110093 RepID=UPI0022FDF2EB|nr:uncharacterized protein BJ171DRAFT_527157 [Polychytrium aggregatum]KAI9193489.1 hypothetical protein BJ171DRAFT_527157 [Polychytrium aggregatum]